MTRHDFENNETLIKVFLDGKQVDVDGQAKVGDEIHIKIKNPVFFSETGKVGFITETEPAKMSA